MDDQLFIGTSGWSYKEWLQVFYPKGTKAGEFLLYYAKRYNAVEVDSTFYAIPKAQSLKRWYEITPPGFIFCLKAPRIITHDKQLVDCQGVLHQFLGIARNLNEKLGCILFQFPYKFSPSKKDLLKNFLDQLPDSLEYVIEVRNKNWIPHGIQRLCDRDNMTYCLVDHPWMPRISSLPRDMKADFVYIRWLGDIRGLKPPFDRIKKDRLGDLKYWSKMVNEYLKMGLRVYGFFNNHYEGYSPASADRFKELLSCI